ncbi:MAG: hypothetical protein WBA74_10740 [Cyclobacteriaceae bacterium]
MKNDDKKNLIEALNAVAEFGDENPEERLSNSIMMCKWAINESQQAWQAIKDKRYH